MTTQWPDLDGFAATPAKRTLHLIAQMLGKTRLALSPFQSNFLFTALFLEARGFGTGPIPVGERVIALDLDAFDGRIAVTSSDGGRRVIDVRAQPTIAAVFRELLAALDALGVQVSLSPLPQEIRDTTPLDADERVPEWSDGDVRRWLDAVAATHGVFERWRAHFFGRSAMQLWWGGFDYALTLFSGKKVAPPRDRGYLFKYDLDAEMFNAGFYPGDDANTAFYFGYIYPEPPGSAERAIAPEGASWSSAMREWVLPYDAVRNAADPAATLRAFLDAIYEGCLEAAQWHGSEFTYTPPPLRRARS